MPGESVLYLIAAATMTIFVFRYLPSTIVILWILATIVFLATRGEIPIDDIVTPTAAALAGGLLVLCLTADIVRPWRRAPVRRLFVNIFHKSSP